MRWTLTLIVLLSLLAPLLAASICGNGICSGDKNCSTCSLDCGKCNAAVCSLDNDCSSGICCNGVCSNSCVHYPLPQRAESPYVSSVLAVGTYSVLLGLVFVVIIAIVLIRRRNA